jgi:spore coat polysaccharide biosynthesis protein SpsF
VTQALGLIQARMGSARLPGKSLADVGGRPLVVLVVERLRRATRLGDVVVATTTGAEDDELAAAVEATGTRVHRGSRDDVLTRLTEAIGAHMGPLVRVTADCPFIDAETVDAVVDLLLDTPGGAYASNVEPRTYPDGLDVEAVANWAWREVAEHVTDPFEREHVTLAIRRDPERYPHVLLQHADPFLANLRWTVDYDEDLEFARQVASRLGEDVVAAGLDDVLAAIRRQPSLAGYADAWGPRG